MMAVDDSREAGADPERTCAGCRQQDARDALLRFVVGPDEPRLVPDPRRRLPGRGVSVHPTRDCLRRAVERGGFARALRMKLAVDTEALCALVAAQYERRLEGLLAAARRNRSLVMGTEAVRTAFAEQAVPLLIVAHDAAGRREELTEQAMRLGGHCVVYGTKSELGRLMGRAELGVMAILDPGIAREVVAVAARATELAGPGSPRSGLSEAE
jgi:predicted RNA-binding protein YlxR (DUF448 family)/ribosomal protein L30E